LDPFAQAVFFPPEFSRKAACFPGKNIGNAPLGVLPTKSSPFYCGEDCCLKHTNDAIIYELHVRAFTMRDNSGVSASNRGTFEGIVEKIPYLKDLGVTILELMPVFQSDPQDPETYWGYMPLSFFSPQSTYAESSVAEEVKNEFKLMVKKLHEADIEVIIDVVYNHTVEANEHGPCYSYRGIDNTTFYLLTDDMSQYRNDSGTGNTFRCAHPYVRKLIVESMRYWAKEMHVDGFRFDLASIFARNLDGSLNLTDPPIIVEITADPDFANLRLIAEVWERYSVTLAKVKRLRKNSGIIPFSNRKAKKWNNSPILPRMTSESPCSQSKII
jgi:isoamylase